MFMPMQVKHNQAVDFLQAPPGLLGLSAESLSLRSGPMLEAACQDLL